MTLSARTVIPVSKLSPEPVSVSQSSCECMFGMSPVGGSAEFGCKLDSACKAVTCHSTAVCQTALDGQARSDTESTASPELGPERGLRFTFTIDHNKIHESEINPLSLPSACHPQNLEQGPGLEITVSSVSFARWR